MERLPHYIHITPTMSNPVSQIPIINLASRSYTAGWYGPRENGELV